MLASFDENWLSDKWRLQNLYKIVNKDSKLVTFKPNAIQKIMNQSTNPRKMILKPRQIGSTTNFVLKLLDRTIFNRNVTACIMAHKDDAIQKIFRVPKRAFRNMPAMICPELDKGGGSKYMMGFPKINSLIYCDLESRGDTISDLHISEAAFIPFERFMATMQAVPVNGRVTIESTPNGVGNWFYDMWQEDNNYEKLFFPWFMDQGYKISAPEKLILSEDEKQLIKYAAKKFKVELTDDQIRWRREKQQELKDSFLQEYPEDDTTCFLLSGGAVVDRLLLQELSKKAKPVIARDGEIEIFKKRKGGTSEEYVIGADCAQGVGGDYSVAVVYEVSTFEEVAILRGQFAPLDFARRIVRLADIYTSGYKKPLIAVENNNHGHAVLLELLEYQKYPNVYFDDRGKPGWTTNMITRPIMLDQLVDALENHKLQVNSKQTLSELITLVNKNGKIQAADGKHDDCVMAAAIALQMLLIEAGKIKVYENVSDAIMV